jgi:hypothetical protein
MVAARLPLSCAKDSSGGQAAESRPFLTGPLADVPVCRESRPDRAISNELLSGPWVRTVAAYAGVATVSPAGLLQAQNDAAGHQGTGSRAFQFVA